MQINGWKLVDKAGTPVERNASYKDFRGETCTIVGGAPPHKPGANGYVYAAGGAQYYASVFDMTWIKE